MNGKEGSGLTETSGFHVPFFPRPRVGIEIRHFRPYYMGTEKSAPLLLDNDGANSRSPILIVILMRSRMRWSANTALDSPRQIGSF